VQWILYGGLMIAIVFVLPQGIVPAFERALTSWTRRKDRPAAAALAARPKAGERP
jgi:branched-chain amino acid transport system permease protein